MAFDIKSRWSDAALFHSDTAENVRAALIDAVSHRANLSGANLSGADLSRAYLSGFSIVPSHGSFIGWKKLANGAITKLGISKNAKRVSSLVGRKCRAEYAKVLAIYGEPGSSSHDPNFEYRVGKIVRPDSFDNDIRVECTHGIHFFITREEAEAY